MVPKIGSRCSDGPISRFRFCGENVVRSFGCVQTIRFSEPTKNLHFSAKTITGDIMQNFSAPFILQDECRMKIEHIPLPSVFFKLTDSCVVRSLSMCSHDPTVGTNENRILKNRSCERVSTHAHPKFVYKLNINNHKTVSNEKDMNNLFN